MSRIWKILLGIGIILDVATPPILTAEAQNLPPDVAEAWDQVTSGNDIPVSDKRAWGLRKITDNERISLRIQKVKDKNGNEFFHNIPNKVLSMNDEQMTLFINLRNGAIRRGEKEPDPEGPSTLFETECSIVLDQREIISDRCVIDEDHNASFPMVGIYPNIKSSPYFLIWSHLPTHERSGRSADMLYWNGAKAISPAAKIFISEVAGHFSSDSTDSTICWNGGKNAVCYKKPQ